MTDIVGMCCCLLGATFLFAARLQADLLAEAKRRTKVLSTGHAPANQDPHVFGPQLVKHPDDEGFRTAAMVYYSRVSKNFALLRKNTFAMIEYHPGNNSIYYENAIQFYTHPKYRNEVIERLENQLKRGNRDRDLYFVLAKVCEQGAVPPLANSSWSRARFIHYFGLPKYAALQKKANPVLADKAVQYYKDAIAAAGNIKFYPGFYSKQLAGLLRDLGRYAEGVEVCEAALPALGEVEKADLLVEYGNCLVKTRQLDQAKQVLNKVRGYDTEGYEGGPACSTVAAETILGLIALQQGDIAEANNHLLASFQVQKCPHNITKGLSLQLASTLLDAGQTGPVIQFCQTVLTNFTPGQRDTEALLRRAQRAEENVPAPKAI